MEPAPGAKRKLAAYQGSQLGFRSQLNLFEIPITDTSIVSTKYVQHTPLSSTKDLYSPVTFICPPSQLSYIDLAGSNLYIQAKILNRDDSILLESDIVAPSSLFFYSMWKNLNFSINNVTISDSNGLFAYEHTIPTILMNGPGEKSSELTSMLFYPDAKPNDYNISTNPSFKKRVDIAKGSRVFDLLGNLPINLSLQQRYLPNNCGLKFEFIRQEAAFCLDCASTSKEYRVSIEKCIINLRMLTISENILTKQNQMFTRNKAQYPIRDRQVRVVQVAVGTLTFVTNTSFLGRIPEILILGLIDSNGLNGNLSKNFLNFQDFKVSRIKVSCGEELIREIQVDYTSDLYLEAYHTLSKAIPFNTDGNNIDRDAYKTGGNCLYLVDILPPTIGSEFNSTKYGQIKVELQFSQATADSIYLVLHASHQAMIEIDSSRNVFVV